MNIFKRLNTHYLLTLPFILVPLLVTHRFQDSTLLIKRSGVFFLFAIIALILVSIKRSRNAISNANLKWLGGLVAFILALAVISKYNSINPSESYWELLYLSGWISIYACFMIYSTKEIMQHIIVASSIVGAVLSLLLFNDVFHWIPIYGFAWSTELMGSTFGVRNYFGQYLCFTTPASIISLFMLKSKKTKLLILMCFLLNISGLILTRSRAAWLGVFIACLVFTFLNRHLILSELRVIKNSKSSIAILMASVLLIIYLTNISVSIVNKTTVWQTLSALKQLNFNNDFWQANSNSGGRLNWYRSSIGIIKDHLALGIGLGNWRLLRPKYSYNEINQSLYVFSSAKVSDAYFEVGSGNIDIGEYIILTFEIDNDSGVYKHPFSNGDLIMGHELLVDEKINKLNTIPQFKFHVSDISVGDANKLKAYVRDGTTINPAQTLDDLVGITFTKIGKKSSAAFTDEDFTKIIQRPHNDFLWLLSEVGIIGMVFVVGFLIYHLRLLLLALKKGADSDDERYLLMFCLISLIAIGIESMFDFPRQRTMPNLYLWSIMGFIASSNTQSKSKNKHQNALPMVLAAILSVVSVFAYFDMKSNIYSQDAKYYKNNNMPKELYASSVIALSFYRNLDNAGTPIYYYMGIAKHQLGDKNAARLFFQRALQLAPFHIGVLTNYMILLGELGELMSAHKIMSIIQHVYPRIAKPRLDMAKFYLREGKYHKAEKILLKLKENNLDDGKRTRDKLLLYIRKK